MSHKVPKIALSPRVTIVSTKKSTTSTDGTSTSPADHADRQRQGQHGEKTKSKTHLEIEKQKDNYNSVKSTPRESLIDHELNDEPELSPDLQLTAKDIQGFWNSTLGPHGALVKTL